MFIHSYYSFVVIVAFVNEIFFLYILLCIFFTFNKCQSLYERSYLVQKFLIASLGDPTLWELPEGLPSFFNPQKEAKLSWRTDLHPLLPSEECDRPSPWGHLSLPWKDESVLDAEMFRVRQEGHNPPSQGAMGTGLLGEGPGEAENMWKELWLICRRCSRTRPWGLGASWRH